LPFCNEGHLRVGSFLMGLNPIHTGSVCFGTDDTAFDDGDTYLGVEVLRKIATWYWDGDIPKMSVTIAQSEANGSGLQEIALCTGSEAGSDISSRDISSIGSKESSFSVDITMELRLDRG